MQRAMTWPPLVLAAALGCGDDMSAPADSSPAPTPPAGAATSTNPMINAKDYPKPDEKAPDAPPAPGAPKPEDEAKPAP